MVTTCLDYYACVVQLLACHVVFMAILKDTWTHITDHTRVFNLLLILYLFSKAYIFQKPDVIQLGCSHCGYDIAPIFLPVDTCYIETFSAQTVI